MRDLQIRRQLRRRLEVEFGNDPSALILTDAEVMSFIKYIGALVFCDLIEGDFIRSAGSSCISSSRPHVISVRRRILVLLSMAVTVPMSLALPRLPRCDSETMRHQALAPATSKRRFSSSASCDSASFQTCVSQVTYA
jgi:hypothetical protein